MELDMQTWQWIAIGATVAALLLIIVVAMAMRSSRKKKSEKLREEFGNEYSRAVAVNGDRKSAEKELEVRQSRVESYKIRELSSDESSRFAGRWRVVQAEFVNEPTSAVARADELLAGIMGARGYDLTSPEKSADDLSAGHPADAAAYREAREIAVRSARGNATTEDLRRAMLAYGQVIDDMLVSTPSRN